MARIAKREQMRRVLARWQRSGESGAAFCRREGIGPQRLWYWKRVLRIARPGAGRRRAVAPADLVPVRLVDAASGMAANGGLEITLASGDRLVVREGVSHELLREVLTVLRERC
jgi:hypothetical protein